VLKGHKYNGLKKVWNVSEACAGLWSGLQQLQIKEAEEGVNIMLYPRTWHREFGIVFELQI
jgi:hypothetical protein